MKKGVIKARVLTSVYILQSNRHSFSGGAVDPTCQFCRLENEDIYHMVTRCPAYHDIRVTTMHQLRQIVLQKCSMSDEWRSHFCNWDTILKVLMCPDCITPLVPELSVSIICIEKLARTFFYTLHRKRLRLCKQRE